MADGGDLFGYKDPELGDRLDNDDEEEGEEEEVDRTQPFQPGAASTPYHGGEQYQMQTMQHEQSGLPDASYEEAPLLGAQSERQTSLGALTHWFPRASATNLETSYSKTGRLQVKMFGAGKKAYHLFTKDMNTGQERLNPSLPKEIKKSLGKSAEEMIGEDRDSIREERQRLAEAENQQRHAETLPAEREKQAQEKQNLRQQIERAQARIDALQEDHGSNLESELNRLKQLKNNCKSDLEEKKKELAALEKQ